MRSIPTQAALDVMELVSRANKYIEETAPWALAKDPEKAKELASVMAHLAHVLYVAGRLLSPILVTKSDKLFVQLGLTPEEASYEDLKKFGKLNGHKVNKGEQLFPRLDAASEEAAIVEMMNGPKEKSAA